MQKFLANDPGAINYVYPFQLLILRSQDRLIYLYVEYSTLWSVFFGISVAIDAEIPWCN